MNTNYKPRIMTGTDNHRSYFAWGGNMQVVRKGHGEIAMTESELVRFFGVTWRKLNHKLQSLMKSPNLHLDEREAGEEPVFINGRVQGYASLYPLSVIIALSFLLDSTEAYLFREYVCRKLGQSISVITSILLFGNADN